VAVDTYDEGLPMTCANCNKEIHSSYGPTDDDYEQMIKEHFESITGHAPSVSVLNKCLAYVQDKDTEQEGHFGKVGEWVHEFIDDDAHGHEKPVGRQQIAAPTNPSGDRYVYRLGAWICPVCHRTHYPEHDKITPPEKCDTCGTRLKPPVMKAVGRKQTSDTKNIIEVWTYDVWGNEEDGYEVNDRSKISEYETDLTELSDKDIKEIIAEQFFEPETICDDGNGDDQHIYLVLNDKEHSDYPLGEIYLDRG